MLSVPRKISRENIFLKHFTIFKILETFSEQFSVDYLLSGWSKLHSKCPEEYFEEKFFFENLKKFQSLCTLSEKFCNCEQKILGRVSIIAFYVSRGTLWGKNFLQTITENFFVIFSTFYFKRCGSSVVNPNVHIDYHSEIEKLRSELMENVPWKIELPFGILFWSFWNFL